MVQKHCPPCPCNIIYIYIYCSGYQKQQSDRLLIYEEMPRLGARTPIRVVVHIRLCCKSIYGTQKGAAQHLVHTYDLQQITDQEIRFASNQMAGARESFVCQTHNLIHLYSAFQLSRKASLEFIAKLCDFPTFISFIFLSQEDLKNMGFASF